MKPRYINELDGVRGCAALMVMFFHFFQVKGFHGAQWKDLIQKLSIFGQTGVTLFFVLSGFLVTRILLSSKNGQGYFKNFYIRRVLRIFPLYYLFLLLYYWVFPLFSDKGFIPWPQQWYFWVYLQNFAYTFNWNISGPYHFWSLAVEEHFYLLLPLLIYFLPLKRLVTSVYILIAVSFIVRVILLKQGYSVFCFTFTNLDALLAGTLLAIKENKYGLSSFSFKKFGLQLLLLIVPTIVIWMFTGGKSLFFIQAFKYPLISYVYYSLLGIVLSAGKSNFLKSLFTNKFIRYTGKISYGLYVYHPLMFVYYTGHWDTNNFVLDLLICFAFAFSVASVSYFFFESRISTLKKHFEGNKNAGTKKSDPGFGLFNNAT